MIQVPKAEVNFTISNGVRASLVLPPMVPRIPEIDLIKVTLLSFFFENKGSKIIES